jgi:hypothetical protein
MKGISQKHVCYKTNILREKKKECNKKESEIYSECQFLR